jgi:hypothetical protein
VASFPSHWKGVQFFSLYLRILNFTMLYFTIGLFSTNILDKNTFQSETPVLQLLEFYLNKNFTISFPLILCSSVFTVILHYYYLPFLSQFTFLDILGYILISSSHLYYCRFLNFLSYVFKFKTFFCCYMIKS